MAEIPYKFYKTNVNGVDVYDVFPSYNTPNGYTPVTDLGEIRDAINQWSSKTDDWSKNYVQSLQQGLQKVQSGIADYATGPDGRLITKASQQAAIDEQAKVASGELVPVKDALGNTLYVPAGSPADLALQNPASANIAGNYPTGATQGTQSTPSGLGLELYLDPDGQTVRDNQGNYISVDDYKRITGQSNTPNEQLNWSFVKPYAWNSPEAQQSSQQPPAGTPANTPATPTTPGAPATPTTGGATPTADSGSYSTGDPNLDALLARFQQQLSDLKAAGQMVNPNIEITPEQVQAFIDQAEAEVEPYYSNIIRVAKDSLNRGLQDLQKQYELDKQAFEANFKQNLDTRREDLAGRGLAFSGNRGRQEQNMADAANLSLEKSAQSASQAAQNAVSAAEVKLGSRNITDLSLPNLSQYTASTSGAGSVSASRTLPFSTLGGVTGDVEYNRNQDVRQLSDFLQQQEVRKRVLNF